MRRRAPFLLSIAGAVAAGHGLPQEPPEPLEHLGNRLARTTCADAAVEIETVANRHIEGQKDQLETRRCTEGLSTTYVGQTTSDPDGLPLTVEIVAPGAGLPPYLEIGEPVQRATHMLGAPAEQARGSLTYGLGIEGINTVVIRHSEGRITSVQWCWVVD